VRIQGHGKALPEGNPDFSSCLGGHAGAARAARARKSGEALLKAARTGKPTKALRELMR